MKRLSSEVVPIVDGHLDLAENVTIFGRDLTRDLSFIRRREKRTLNQISVTLPELKKGNVVITFATVTPGFLPEDVGKDFEPKSAIYHDYREAEAQAMSQIDLYEGWERNGFVRIIKSVNDLEDHLHLWNSDHAIGLVLLMEGADPIIEIKDLPKWWSRGLRMIGLTFGDTKYGAGVAGGTTKEKKEGISEKGIELLEEMAELGLIWDISHLTERGVWQGLDLGFQKVFASHANSQALMHSNRHLSDEIIKEVAKRGGVIGLVLYNGFLDMEWRKDHSVPVSLAEQFRNHAEHIAKLTSWKHVGIGSDFDGGFGSDETPMEIDSIADLYKIGDVVPVEFREDVLSINWINFLRRSLPERS